MLEAFINFICALILSILGFYVIKIIINSDDKLTIKTLLLLTINSICIALFHYFNYNSTLVNFIINTITYKLIFKINIKKAILLTGILSLFILIADLISLALQLVIFPLYKYADNSYIFLLNNLSVVVISLILLRTNIIKKYLSKIFNTLSNNSYRLNIIFISIIIIIASGIMYNLFINYKIDYKVFVDLIILVGLLIILFIFIINKETYNKLSQEYDILLSNVNKIEEWIEKEQFTRHEYKNQLAVIYSLSNEKNVKTKIEEIIKHNLNVSNETIYELRELPKGELKGILYYKTLIAQDNKINLTIDTSIKSKGILSKLNKKQINSLAKIIGIYYDNAIEAAKESRKKIILLEIYELKDKVNIVISNTYKKTTNLHNNHLKGISSKGKGRGNGLYFANKIISDNQWLIEKHEIIDRYYIETITINKSTSK